MSAANSGADNSVNATREGQTRQRRHPSLNDSADSNLRRRSVLDEMNVRPTASQRWLNVGTWNVCTLNEPGRIEQVQFEAERLKIDVLGMAEVRWIGNGVHNVNGWRFYYSGADVHHRGVGFLVSPKVSQAVTAVQPVSDRIMRITIQAKPKPVSLIQVYLPTAEAEEEESNEQYRLLQETVNLIPRQHRMIVMGDFNAKIGENTEHPCCGRFGLGEMNDRGAKLLDWLEDNALLATNTCFRHRKKERYTWVSPGGMYKNMIDYIAIRIRDRKECMDARALASADCGSDHQLVWAKIRGRAWNSNKKVKAKKTWNLEAINPANFEMKLRQKIEGETDITWKKTAEAYTKTLDEECPKTTSAKRPWINSECMELIEKRRSKKRECDQGPEYRELCRRVKKECRRAKRKWMEEIAREAEIAARTSNSRQTYKLIKTLTRRNTCPSLGIEDKNGVVLFGEEEILERWHEYATDLFKEPSQAQPAAIDKGEEEPNVMEDEIRAAMKKIKRGKAPGVDQIPAEALKAGGETSIEMLKQVIDKIWATGEWPEEWTISELIVLPKTPKTRDCGKHRTISLISHASKILLEIIRNRMSYHVHREMAEEQFGFVPGKGTTEAIIALRNILEKATQKNNEEELWVLFIDYSKAFDSVYHPALWQTLLEFGFPQHIVWLLQQLYEKAKGVIRIGDRRTKDFRFGKGVRQGCLLSPALFIIVGECIMRLVKEKIGERAGYIVGGRAVWNIRYADDTTLLAKSRGELESMAEALHESSKKFGLEMNKNKTKVMKIHGTGDFTVQGELIDEVEEFKFLGSYVTSQGDSATEVRRRLGAARTAASKLSNVWKSKDLSTRTKVRLAKSLVWSVALYGCESWTMKKEDERRLSAFEMWLWRRLLCVRWTDRRTNSWVRQQVGVTEREGLLEEMKKRKIRKYCHWKRRPESVVMTTIEGMAPGREKRGRRRRKWIDNIKAWTDMPLTNINQFAMKRKMPTARTRAMADE